VEHIWSVLCRLSIVDLERNNVSLIEIMERLLFRGEVVEIPEDQIAGLPYPVELVTLWSRSEPNTSEVSRARVLIFSPEGKSLNEAGQEYPVDLTQYQRFRAMGRFDVLPFVGNGFYRFVVQKFDEDNDRWIDVASIPLEIVRETSAQE
jgi:hypothetical protein